MIYKITLTNKKTGRDISRDYDLRSALRAIDFNLELYSMLEALEDNEEKF